MNKIRLSLTIISFFAIAAVAQEDKPSSLPPYMPQSVMSPKVLEFVENSAARGQAMAIKRTYKYDALGRHIRSNRDENTNIVSPLKEKMRVIVVDWDTPENNDASVFGEYTFENGTKIYKLNGSGIPEADYFRRVKRERNDISIGYVAELTADEIRALSNGPQSVYIGEYTQPHESAVYSAIFDTSLVSSWAHANNYKGQGVGVFFSEAGCPLTSLVNSSYFTQNSSCSEGITRHATAMVRIFQATAPQAMLYEYNQSITSAPSPSSTSPQIEIGFFSWNSGGDDLYNGDNVYLDTYIYTNSVTTFVSAGNQTSSTDNHYVTSPGKALNAITVGGVYPFTNMYEPFSKWQNSEVGNQKPEIANYDYFYFPSDPTFTDSNGDTYDGYMRGTSVANAYTAGIMADILQQHPFFKGHPEMTKALLITGSTKTIVGALNFDQDNNSQAAKGIPLYRDMGWNTRSRYWNGPNSSSFVNDSITFTESNIVSGKRYRIAISWLNPSGYTSQHNKPSQDIDLYVKQNGSIIASSTSAKNPFEAVDFTTSSANDLTIIIKRFANSGTGKVALGYNMWCE